MVAIRYCLTCSASVFNDVSVLRELVTQCYDVSRRFIDLALHVLGGKVHDDGTR